MCYEGSFVVYLRSGSSSLVTEVLLEPGKMETLCMLCALNVPTMTPSWLAGKHLKFVSATTTSSATRRVKSSDLRHRRLREPCRSRRYGPMRASRICWLLKDGKRLPPTLLIRLRRYA